MPGKTRPVLVISVAFGVRFLVQGVTTFPAVKA
jgi:hypothetical protein